MKIWITCASVVTAMVLAAVPARAREVVGIGKSPDEGDAGKAAAVKDALRDACDKTAADFLLDALRPFTENPDIRLVDGRVACITCHKVKNETAALNETLSSAQPAKPQCTVTKELTTGHSRDELCLSCHVK